MIEIVTGCGFGSGVALRGCLGFASGRLRSVMKACFYLCLDAVCRSLTEFDKIATIFEHCRQNCGLEVRGLDEVLKKAFLPY